MIRIGVAACMQPVCLAWLGVNVIEKDIYLVIKTGIISFVLLELSKTYFA